LPQIVIISARPEYVDSAISFSQKNWCS